MNRRYSLALLATLALLRVARGEDWPQWRGPLRDGTSPETEWETDWRSNPPTLLWEEKVGDGVSHPAIVDGKVYIFGLIQSRKDEVQCLRLDDGSTVWRSMAATEGMRLDRPRSADGKQQRRRGGGSRIVGSIASPSVSDGQLFTYHRSHDLRCWHADSGALAWEVNLLATYGLCSSKVRQYWTPGNSPLVLGDLVIVSGYGVTGAVALNKESGELVWKAAGVDDSDYDGPRPEKRGSNNWASPTAVRVKDRMCVVINLNRDVVCLDAATGEELWRHQEAHWPGPATVSDPVLVGRTIVVPGYRRGEGVGLVLDHGGQLIRRLPNLLIQSGTPVHHEGWVFTHRDAVNVETGSRARTVMGAPIIVGGHLIVLRSRGLSLAEPRQGVLEPLGSVPVEADTWAAPVFSSGRILFRSTRTTLACWDIRRSL